MIIGIDGNEANIEKRVGVNQYGFELLWAISKLEPEWGKKHQVIVYLKNSPLPDLPKETKNFKYRVLPGKGLWILTQLTPHLLFDKDKPNLMFSPSHYVPPLSFVPRACSIMDLGYLEFSGQFKKKDYWQLKLWTAISIMVSKYIFAISKSTKEDIVRHYSFARKKTFAIPLGYDKSRFNTKVSANDVRRVKNRYHIANDYVLFLGTLKPSKNVDGLLIAWKAVTANFPEVKLVIVGKKGWLFDSIFKKVKDLGLEDKVVFTGFVSEKEKPALIYGAKIFSMPSFWEGFGLDALTAMAAGTPVIVSNVGSLPEVVGKAGLLIDPKDPKDIGKSIIKVLSMNKKQYNKVVEKGLSQAKKFSWEKTARETLKILTR